MSELNERVKRQIALLAGDDLEVAQSEEARKSVEACPDCRRHWVRVRGCLDVLERTGKESTLAWEASLWPAVERRLVPQTLPRRERFNGWVPALSVAAACIALLALGQMDAAPTGHDALDVELITGPPPLRPMPAPRNLEWPPVADFARVTPSYDRGGPEAFLLRPFRVDPVDFSAQPSVSPPQIMFPHIDR